MQMCCVMDDERGPGSSERVFQNNESDVKLIFFNTSILLFRKYMCGMSELHANDQYWVEKFMIEDSTYCTFRHVTRISQGRGGGAFSKHFVSNIV